MPITGVTTICFSATASFSAGVVLSAIGIITLRRARQPAERPLAAIPAIFGAQQLIEGALWLGLPAHSPSAHALTIAYLLFSHVLWPFYVPLAVWLIEPSAAHRRRIAVTLFAGAAISLFFLAIIVINPVSATIHGMHIRYHVPHPNEEVAFALYAMAACIAPLLSSYSTVRLLGLAITASMIAAYIVYAVWFASVWCFFAAVVSAVVYRHFSESRRRAPALAAPE